MTIFCVNGMLVRESKTVPNVFFFFYTLYLQSSQGVPSSQGRPSSQGGPRRQGVAREGRASELPRSFALDSDFLTTQSHLC